MKKKRSNSRDPLQAIAESRTTGELVLHGFADLAADLFLDDVLTPLPAADAMRAIREAYRRLLGEWPAARALAVLYAQCVLETGHFRSMHRFNFGNVKRGNDWPGYWTAFRCNEIIGGRVQWFDPPHPQTHFRAFRTAEDGAADHLEFLVTRERYRDAWGEAYAGNAEGFSRALAKAGYYTADVEKYTSAVVSLAHGAAPTALAISEGAHALYDLARLNALCYATAVASLRGSAARKEV